MNLDKLTYAGNPTGLAEIARSQPQRYRFEHSDICDEIAVSRILRAHDVDTIIHFAAESHVDRSILGPRAFIQTNVSGTFTLLESARAAWKGRDDVLFHHVSTDEVSEPSVLMGSSPNRALMHHEAPTRLQRRALIIWFVRITILLACPVTVSNCSNNYGPYQFPEKMVPLMILNMMEQKELPVYGHGTNIRDWLYVEDHCAAIWALVQHGGAGETYNVGGGAERRNIDLLHELCEIVAQESGQPIVKLTSLIRFVTDRPGHDGRYAIDFSKMKSELGWAPAVSLTNGLRKTVRWYLTNKPWVDQVRTGEYLKWIKDNYSGKESKSGM